MEPLLNGRTRLVQSDEPQGAVVRFLGGMIARQTVSLYQAFNRELKARAELVAGEAGASTSQGAPAEVLPALHAGGAERELIVNGFRAPSTGVELRDGWLGYHLGVYPTTIDTNAEDEPRTTWFLKVGVLAYPFRFDTGSGRPS